MSNVALDLLVIGAALAAVVAPLAVYALMPRKLLELSSEHGRYTGLGMIDQSSGVTGHAPAIALGSLQRQAG